MKKLLLIFAILICCACEKTETFSCLQEKIDEFAAGDYACETGASVKEYKFQDKLVSMR